MFAVSDTVIDSHYYSISVLESEFANHIIYLKCKIVRTCDSSHFLMTMNFETVQRNSATKVTYTDNVTF